MRFASSFLTHEPTTLSTGYVCLSWDRSQVLSVRQTRADTAPYKRLRPLPDTSFQQWCFLFRHSLNLSTSRRNVLTFQDYTAMYMGYPLFWFVARRSLVCYRAFWAAYRSNFQGPTYKIQYFSNHFSPNYETALLFVRIPDLSVSFLMVAFLHDHPS